MALTKRAVGYDPPQVALKDLDALGQFAKEAKKPGDNKALRITGKRLSKADAAGHIKKLLKTEDTPVARIDEVEANLCEISLADAMRIYQHQIIQCDTVGAATDADIEIILL